MLTARRNHFFATHRKAKWFAIILGGLVLLLVLFLLFFDWNSLRPVLAREITAKTGRPAAIDGDLKVHVWSWNPSVEVNGFTLENPPWADRKLMFGAKRITVSVSLGRLLRGQIVLPQVQLVEPVINLERDSKSRASWELGNTAGTPNHNTQPSKLPTVRRLLIDNGKLHVVDQIRKLRFSGSLVASEQSAKQDAAALQVRAKGSLNEKPFTLDANGGPLLDLAPDKPYSFSAHLTASDISLETHVTVPKPFDLGALDVKFVISGNDLADVYYLTGLALPNTPKYRLAASLQVAGTKYRIDDLKGRLGASDLTGKVEVEAGGERPKLTANLASVTLNMADLAPTLGRPADGANASAAPSAAKAKPGAARNAKGDDRPQGDERPKGDERLLPDADLQVNRVRGMDADVTYKSDAVTAPKLPMKKVAFHLVLEQGLLTLDPLSFVLDQGKFTGSVRIDARQDVPESSIDMRIDNIDLSQFKSATMKQPPLQGTLLGRFQIHGYGGSIHKFAASADGALSMVVPHGDISDVIAELTGINVLQGLGLLLSKADSHAEIRCGVMSFEAQRGVLTAKTLFVDTSNVLITGRGHVDLDHEGLDLSLQGDPKKLRLVRLRSPITLQGTLSHPAVGIKADKLAGQAGVAAALGTLLTPVAAILAFVDPGLAKDKDCSAMLAEASAPLQN
jgi:uncharacterized protein involved in outer membrane biogenesis